MPCLAPATRLVARGGASRQGLKQQSGPSSAGHFPVARGGASRQGLKPIQSASRITQHLSGSWRGFPPGIETTSAILGTQTTATSGSWRGFPPGIETPTKASVSAPIIRGSWRGFPPGIETPGSKACGGRFLGGSWRGFPPGIETIRWQSK